MDVKFIASEWEKTKDAIGDLIGLGVWGKEMIDNLKKMSNNLEDAESHIHKYDSDGIISFHHTSEKKKYQQLFEDFKELHTFTKKVGSIVDDVIDQPFYEDIDRFVEAMRNLRIEDYKTTNRIGATTTIQIDYAQTSEVEKREITLNDLFSGDNYYANQIKLEYDAVKEMNPDQEFTLEDYQQAALNTHAFEYVSIKDGQYQKEFWVNIAALVVIVGTTLICPPAGIALGAVYGTLEISSAVSGNDWVSGRELGTGERWFRGVLAPLDLIPAVGLAKKFVTMGRAGTLHHSANLGQKLTTSASKMKTTIGNTVETAKLAGNKRIAQLKEFGASRVAATGKKLEEGLIETGRVIDKGVTSVRQGASDVFSPQMVTPDGSIFRKTVENNHAVENFFRSQVEDFKGFFGRGSKSTAGGKGSYSFDATSDLKGFSNQIEPILNKHNITLEQFNELRLKNVSELTKDEVKIMKNIRDSVTPITNETLLQKTIPLEDVEKYLSGEYTEIGGYVAKVEDISNVHSYNDVVESLRLDYTSWDGSRPYPKDGDSYAMIRFKSNNPDKIDIPYGERFGGSNTDGPPCTQNGFTAARNGNIVPEWRFDGYYPPMDGAELYNVINGNQVLVGVFDEKLGRFVSP